MSLLAAFTLCESLMVATVCAHYEAHGVGQLAGIAWGITLFIFTARCTHLHFAITAVALPLSHRQPPTSNHRLQLQSVTTVVTAVASIATIVTTALS